MGQRLVTKPLYPPISTRRSGRWPGGRRLAVYVAIGVEDYRPGPGHTEDLLAGIPEPDRVNAAWRDYGNRVGAFKLLERLTQLGIPPTVLLNTMVYDTAPAVIDAARAAGAEIVGHGVSNSDSLADMDPASELAYVAAVAASIEGQEGKRPLGWSSPWLSHTPSTIDSLAASGYRYLLDLRPDDQPVWLHSPAGPLLSIPYALELNDSSTVIGRQATASEFADMIVDEFDELLEASDDHPIVMSIVLHSFISGVPFRLRPLTRALSHISRRADDVWLTQPGRIHRAFAALPASVDALDGHQANGVAVTPGRDA
jgi:peptidoglycan/xylan/chitin deacetylase (PgdA/CDA1 family)